MSVMLPSVRVLLSITEPHLQRLNVAAGTGKVPSLLCNLPRIPSFPRRMELPLLSSDLYFS